MKTPLFLALVIGITAGCHYPNEFRNRPRNTSHSVIRGSANAFASHINGQPTSFWRWGDVFRIPPGTTTCETAYSDRRETHGYRELTFIARPGREYIVARMLEPNVSAPLSATAHPTTQDSWIIHDRRDRITIRDSAPSGEARTIADAPKEDYVFGAPSAESAIAEYQRKHP